MPSFALDFIKDNRCPSVPCFRNVEYHFPVMHRRDADGKRGTSAFYITRECVLRHLQHCTDARLLAATQRCFRFFGAFHFESHGFLEVLTPAADGVHYSNQQYTRSSAEERYDSFCMQLSVPVLRLYTCQLLPSMAVVNEAYIREWGGACGDARGGTGVSGSIQDGLLGYCEPHPIDCMIGNAYVEAARRVRHAPLALGNALVMCWFAH